MTADISVSSNGHAGAGAEERVLDALGNEFSPKSIKVLADAAISPEEARRYGITAVDGPDHLPDSIYSTWSGFLGEAERGMIFTWKDLDREIPQYRPDDALKTPDGKTHKYLAPTGSGTFLNHLRSPRGSSDPVLFVEGSKQGVSAAVWAPETWGVVAVPGCNNWVGTDLTWADGRKVIILFDADFTSNRDVYDAALGLKEALEVEGADEIVFARLAGSKDKEGLDDVLGRRPKDRRTSYIQRISDLASEKIGKAPSRKSTSKYFGDNNAFLARDAALAVLDNQPAALAAGGMIALYRDGVYRIDQNKEPLLEKVTTLLGNDFRPQWRQTIEEFLTGELFGRGMQLPDRMTEPVLNTASCMVDLRTGESMPHDPNFLSSLQIPVMWIPDATCPTYEAWLEEVAGEQGPALEEVAATMLDPSRTPQKAAFLFGPTKSGKSTFLRHMQEIAGRKNLSAVSLHQLAENKFMGAELYGRMLNVSADLSAAHVADTSLFKMLTGEDPVQADRKYGKTFQFTNRALFAFSANEIPTVSETSRAYVQRIAPFSFNKSFAGREDPRIEETMVRDELPGILLRWVGAWRRFVERGTYCPTDPDVQQEFETSSDRVARWVALRCDVHPEVIGKTVGAEAGDTINSLYIAFKIWVKDDGPANVMSRTKFSERLKTIDGVGEVRLRHKNKNLGLNVTTRTGEDRERVQIRTVPSKTGTDPDASDIRDSVGPSKIECGPSVGSGGHNPHPESADQPQDQRSSVGSVGKSPTRGTIHQSVRANEDDLSSSTVFPLVGIQATLPTLPTLFAGQGLDARSPEPTLDPHSAGQDPHRPTDEENDHAGDRDGRKDREGVSLDSGLQGDQDPAKAQGGRSGLLGDRAGGGGEARPGSVPAVSPVITPHVCEEYEADPFADHAPPAPSVPVGIDLETWDAQDLFHHDAAVLGPYVRLVGAGPLDDVATGSAEVLERIKGDNTLVGVNLALFDLPALHVHEGIPVESTVPRAHDIRFCAFQDDPPTSDETKVGPKYKRYNLESLAQRYLGDHKSDLGKALAAEYGGWGHIAMTDSRYHEYCRDDVVKALRLAQTLPMTDYDRREMEVTSITTRATIEGFRVDLPALERRITEQAAELETGRAMLAERFGFPLTNKAGKVAKAPQRTSAGKIAFENAIVATGFPLDVWDRGQDGTLSLAKEIMAEALEHAESEGLDEAALIIRSVQAMNGLRSNAANILRCVTGDRVHPSFEPFQAFGRWSVKEPGLTVLKKAAQDSDRVFMLPEVGHRLVSFDADQVDIRCVTFHSQDPGLLAIMQDPDRDIHNEVSDLAFGRHDDPYRFHAKSCDLGWLYGRSVNGLAGTPGITYEAAQRVDETMRRQFSTVVDWQHDVRQRAEGRALLDNGFGRHFRCDEGREYTQAPAGHGQSMTRDVVAEGLLIMKRTYPELIPMLRLIVHDEIVMSIPEDIVEDVSRKVIECMTIVKGGVPFTWGRSPAGRTWADCYAK
jgi:putative DNA primase/helicase